MIELGVPPGTATRRHSDSGCKGHSHCSAALQGPSTVSSSISASKHRTCTQDGSRSIDIPYQAIQALLYPSGSRTTICQTAGQAQRVEGGERQIAGVWIHRCCRTTMRFVRRPSPGNSRGAWLTIGQSKKDDSHCSGAVYALSPLLPLQGL